MKKKLLFLLLIGSIVVASSCKKIKEATNQNITLMGAEVNLSIASKGTSAQVIELSSTTTTSEIDALIKKEAPSFGLKNVKSLKIKTLTAEITNGSNSTNNFANLEDINAVLEGSGKIFTATYSGTPSANTTKINLTVDSSVDLKDLVSSSSIKYSLKSKIINAITNDLTVKLVAIYDVVVGL